MMSGGLDTDKGEMGLGYSTAGRTARVLEGGWWAPKPQPCWHTSTCHGKGDRMQRGTNRGRQRIAGAPYANTQVSPGKSTTDRSHTSRYSALHGGHSHWEGVGVVCYTALRQRHVSWWPEFYPHLALFRLVVVSLYSISLATEAQKRQSTGASDVAQRDSGHVL